MNVLHVIPSVSLAHGGPSRTSVNLVNHLSDHADLNLHFYSYIKSDESRLDLSPSVTFHSQTQSSSLFSKLYYQDYWRIRQIIRDVDLDLLHVHGIWHPLFHWAVKAALVEGVPYIIQPRGMLEPWARKFKRLKKSVAMAVYQESDLRRASGFIATAIPEAHAIEALGLKSRVAVIPNGVELCVPSQPKLNRFGTKTALFMSRIHPKKGIRDLIRAWSRIGLKGWQLRVVGPDDGGHLKEILDLIMSLGVCGTVKVIGPAYGDARTTEYANADLFILPSYSENFGIAVAEALSYGIPVVTTTGTPWSWLQDYECGWWIEPGEESLVTTLPIATSISNTERDEMGIRAKILASKFDWRDVATQTANFYVEVLSGPVRRKVGD